MTVQVGQPTPDVTVNAYDRTRDGGDDQFPPVQLADYRDRWVCLYFYPRDFTAVCPTEIVAFDAAVGEFDDRDCVLLCASTDSEFSHKGWCDAHDDLGRLKHLMLADPGHAFSKAFGVYDDEKGLAYRGTFLIDPRGVLRWMAVYEIGVGRNVDEVLRVLDALQTDKFCPCNWKPGDDTLN